MKPFFRSFAPHLSISKVFVLNDDDLGRFKVQILEFGW